MKKRLVALLVGVMALALLGAGCGGGEEGTGSSEEAITKAEFKQAADAICLQLNEDTSTKYTAFFEGPDANDPKAVKAMANQVYLSNLEKRVGRLEALPVPEGDKGEVAAILAAMKFGIAGAKAKESIPFGNTQKEFKKANRLVVDYGLKYCFAV